jgi:putative phage-type endonuclease
MLVVDINNCIESLLNDIEEVYEHIDDKIDYCVHILQNLFKSKYIYREYVKQYIHIFFKTNLYETNFICDKDYIKKTLSIDQPEQRSEEWFKFRAERLTASDIATALGENVYAKPKELILKKCGIRKPFHMNDACKHGVKYEPISTMLYEYKKNTKVYEFGCISHKYYNFIGASPDGICSNGTMLEIKNPYSREIVGIPPKYYWIQMQIQMEVFDLWKCDFLECKMTEYYDYDEFKNDNERLSEHKGVLVEYYTSDDYTMPKYNYCPIAYPDPLGWVENEKKKFDNLTNSMYSLNVIWWKIETYSCISIYRDINWFSENLPKLAIFWDDVLNHRRNKTYTLLIPKKRERKKKCLIDIDIDNEEESACNIDIEINNDNINETNFEIKSKKATKCLILD